MKKYRYYGTYLDSSKPSNYNNRILKATNFTTEDFKVGTITIGSKRKGAFKILVKEHWSDDCSNLEPIKIEKENGIIQVGFCKYKIS